MIDGGRSSLSCSSINEHEVLQLDPTSVNDIPWEHLETETIMWSIFPLHTEKKHRKTTFKFIKRQYNSPAVVRLMRIHGEQVFVDGLFNADPHPGNVMLLAQSDGVGLIDFGQVKE